MTNKLRDVFKKTDSLMNGQIRFKDKEAYKEFSRALEQVLQSGNALHVDGIEEVSVNLNSGAYGFPLNDGKGNLADCIIGPASEKKEFPIEIDGQKFILPLIYYQLKNGYKIETEDHAIIQLRLTANSENNQTKVEITPLYEKAENLSTIIHELKKTVAFFKKFFIKESIETNDGFRIIMKHLEQTRFIFSMALFAEEQFEIKFDIAKIDLNDSQSILDLYELYLILFEKKAIRMNAKVTATESTAIEMRGDYHGEVDTEILLTSYGQMEYSIWSKSVRLHVAHLLINAVIKNIEELENGHTRIVYGDTEQKPMYISYKGYKTEEEARKELEDLINHKGEYENAKTAAAYWAEMVI